MTPEKRMEIIHEAQILSRGFANIISQIQSILSREHATDFAMYSFIFIIEGICRKN